MQKQIVSRCDCGIVYMPSKDKESDRYDYRFPNMCLRCQTEKRTLKGMAGLPYGFIPYKGNDAPF